MFPMVRFESQRSPKMVADRAEDVLTLMSLKSLVATEVCDSVLRELSETVLLAS